MLLLHDFIEWVEEKPSRSVSIEIESRKDSFLQPRVVFNQSQVTIFVYDYELQTGQYVKSIGEINLEQIKEQEDYRKYSELKERFETGKESGK